MKRSATAPFDEEAGALVLEHAGTIHSLLERIGKAVDDARPTWCSAGDLGHVKEQLEEIARFIRA